MPDHIASASSFLSIDTLTAVAIVKNTGKTGTRVCAGRNNNVLQLSDEMAGFLSGWEADLEASTAADAAAIPRLVLQGTDNLGVLSDFMISVSGGMLKAQKLTPGTWPL